MPFAVVARRFHKMSDSPKSSSALLDSDVFLILQTPCIDRRPLLGDQHISGDFRETFTTQPLTILGLESIHSSGVGDLVELPQRAAPGRPFMRKETTEPPLLVPACDLFNLLNMEPSATHASAGAASVGSKHDVAERPAKVRGEEGGERSHDPHLVTA